MRTIAPILIHGFLVVGVLGCSSPERRREAEIPGELSLKEDRSRFDELRKAVPQDVRRDNDELALILKDMASPDRDEDPNKIRDRFARAVRQRRETMDAQLRKEREEFGKAERERREKSVKDARDERAAFAARGRGREERKRFFDDQDAKSREFFAAQSERRRAFEADVAGRRKDFEDYVRERQSRFNDELRAYTKAHYERKKGEDLKARMAEKEKRLKKGAERGESPQGGVPPTLGDELAQPPSGKVTPLQAEER